MEITYTMIGADGLQYGPIDLNQLRAWVNEGRITGETKVLRSDTNAWLPASNYSELGLAPAPAMALSGQGSAVMTASPPRPAVAAPAMDPVLVRRVRVGASWFFAIGIFSVINALIALSKSGAFFLVGLGVNLLIPSLVANFIVCGIFALLGVFARKGQIWSFIVGMILYGLDALIFLPTGLWLPLAFHAYVLFRIFMGLKACFELNAPNHYDEL